jgi:hypothetical protein
MTAEHEDHGNTPAAWTLVITFIIGSVISGVGFIIANPPVAIGGLVVCALGLLLGKVLAMAGFGKKPEAGDAEAAAEPADAEA